MAVYNKNIVNHFEINFINECLLGDQINVFHIKNETGEYVSGCVEDKVVFNAYVK